MRRCLVLLLLLLATTARAQIKTITGGGYQYPSGTICSGCVLTLQLVADAVVSGTGQIAPKLQTYTLDANGNVPAGSTLWGNDQLQPVGTTYKATLSASGGGQIWGPEYFSIAGTSPINLAQLIPVANPAVYFSNPVTTNGTNTLTGTNTFNGPVNLSTVTISGPSPWIDVTSPTYGAKCDGSTDDSVALQAALTAAANVGGTMRLPAGFCNYGTTLTSTKTVSIEGVLEASSGATAAAPISTLRYTGTGNGITISNGANVIFNVHLKSFNLLGTVVNNQGTGIACTNCNTLVIRDVMVGSSNNPGFANAYDFTQDALVSAENIGAFNTAVVFRLISAGEVDIARCNTFAHSIAFLLGENTSGIGNTSIQIHNCPNIERVNRVLVIDDTNPATTTNIAGEIVFTNNFVAFDGGPATYPNQQLLYLNNTSTNQLTVDGLVIRDNYIYCNPNAGPQCSATYAANIAISGTSPASTHINGVMEGNFIFNFSSGAVTANSSKANISMNANQNFTSALVPNTDTNGAGTFCVQKFQGGNWNISCPVANFTSTFANLGSVPAAGISKFCTDCTTAATCAGGGSGHMAVSNGTNWTCQ